MLLYSLGDYFRWKIIGISNKEQDDLHRLSVKASTSQKKAFTPLTKSGKVVK